MKFLKLLLFSFLSIMAFDSCSQSLNPIISAPPPSSGMVVIANPLVNTPIVITNNSKQGWMKIELGHSSIIETPSDVVNFEWIFDEPGIVFNNGTNANDENPIVRIPYGTGSEFEFQIHLNDGSFAETEGFLFVDDGNILFPAGTLAYLIPRIQLAYVPGQKISYTEDSITKEFTADTFALDYEDDATYEHESPDNPTWIDPLSPDIYIPKYYVIDSNIWSDLGEYFSKPIFRMT